MQVNSSDIKRNVYSLINKLLTELNLLRIWFQMTILYCSCEQKYSQVYIDMTIIKIGI